MDDWLRLGACKGVDWGAWALGRPCSVARVGRTGGGEEECAWGAAAWYPTTWVGTTLEGLRPTALGGGTGTASGVYRDGVHGLREERS